MFHRMSQLKWFSAGCCYYRIAIPGNQSIYISAHTDDYIQLYLKQLWTEESLTIFHKGFLTCEKLPGNDRMVLMPISGTIMTEDKARHQPTALAPSG